VSSVSDMLQLVERVHISAKLIGHCLHKARLQLSL
jgi:hypothetical protein